MRPSGEGSLVLVNAGAARTVEVAWRGRRAAVPAPADSVLTVPLPA